MREKNLVEEMHTLNKMMQNPSNEIYKTSSSWDKHPNPPNNKNIEIMIKEILNYIIKMDAKLTNIETTFSDVNSKKRKSKSFWDNFLL